MKNIFFCVLLFLYNFLVAQNKTTYSYTDKEGSTITDETVILDLVKKKNYMQYSRWTVLSKYSNGQIKRSGAYLKGNWDGEWKRYAKNGTLLFEGKFENGYRVGTHFEYFENGKLSNVAEYLAGKYEGYSIDFDYSGDTAAISTYKDGDLLKKISYHENSIKSFLYSGNKLNGPYTEVSRNGIVLKKGNFLNGNKIGEWTCFDSVGNKIYSYVFSKSDTAKDLQEIKPCHFQENQLVNKTFTVVESMPEFVGGENALFKFVQYNIRYPSYSRDNDLMGRQIIGFVVDEDGRVANVRPYNKQPFNELMEEAIRVIELLPNFKPGSQQGKNVRVAYILPVMFKLQ
jgi:antitoxin component YwqK of YwqJK toxin-antitoxin module